MTRLPVDASQSPSMLTMQQATHHSNRQEVETNEENHSNPAGLPSTFSTRNTNHDVENGCSTIDVITMTNTKNIGVNSSLRNLPDNDDDESSVNSQLKKTGKSCRHPSCCASKIRPLIFAIISFLVGVMVCTAFLIVGISGENKVEDALFHSHSLERVNQVESAWESYTVAALWIHHTCWNRNFTRLEFKELYEHLISTGIKFQTMSFIPNVTQAERKSMEAEAQVYYQEIAPDWKYQGFVGLEANSTNADGATTLKSRSIQPFYFPIHYIEPFVGNEAAVDFDPYSSTPRKETIDLALKTWKPALTSRIRLVQETDLNTFSVVLFHPGIQTSSESQPRDLSSVVVRIPALLERSTVAGGYDTSIYLFDSTDSTSPPQFLGGAIVRVTESGAEITITKATEIATLRASKNRLFEKKIIISSREWTVVIVAVKGTFEPKVTFVIMGGIIILVTCIALSVWVYMSMRRASKISTMKSKVQAEKALFILENATKSAKAERELNDFIAHEVRNPLAAAMSACTFVAAVLEDESTPLIVADSRRLMKEDMVIVESSLHFINDLLRNMLDMQRAISNQLNIEMSPTDLLRDVLEPVDSLLYRRNDNFQVVIDCPKNLVVMTDSLRLKQIVLNLSRNAIKFVDRGFIRLRAAVVDGTVQVSVEDSGPGIPIEKHDNLFVKFQETLDLMNQGTGIGLCLCKNLSDLMNGELWFDKTYVSGVKDFPGTRFVINLNVAPLNFDDAALERYHDVSNCTDHEIVHTSEENEEPLCELPQRLVMLFVDDDLVLRKLFTRAVKRVAPGWDIHEAANGETALRLVDSQEFDLIFVDQYMASAEKQLLGTETTRALRAKGVKAKICGLSANDVKQSFHDAGANSFMFKPFPCQKNELTRALVNIIYSDEDSMERITSASYSKDIETFPPSIGLSGEIEAMK